MSPCGIMMVHLLNYTTPIIMMLRSKGILTSMIWNCSALRAPTILKNIRNSHIFFKKLLLTHIFGGSKCQKSSRKQACIGLLTF